jgi:DNA-binding IclR family transcriptional regulator
VICLVAPVFDAARRAIAAVSATAIKSHLLSVGQAHVADRVRATAERLSRIRGHR